MLIDFDALNGFATDPVEVAIVGAGPAGITLALELASRGIRSLLVEAGGFDYPDADGLDPYQGDSSPRPYALNVSRLRYFGGTSGHWGGWVRPLDVADFEVDQQSGAPAWPIARGEAYRRLDDAHRWLEVPETHYDGPALAAELDRTALNLPDDSGFRTQTFRFSPPTRFGARYRKDIVDSERILCLLETSLIAVERAVEGRSRVRLRHRDGRQSTVSARFHVLAMGGVENARSLMWSNRTAERPFGAEGDWLGRCFADHFGFTAGHLLASPMLDYNTRGSSEGRVMARHVPEPSRVRSGEVINHMISLHAVNEQSFLQHGYGRNEAIFGAGSDALKLYAVLIVAGQTPSRDSRLTLMDETDSNGVARVRLNWHIEEADFLALLGSFERFGRAVGAVGLGRMRKTAFYPRKPDEALSAGMHHMGTTRMAPRSGQGVVDTDCRVFDSDDLYLAGSSVFPAYGYANPTLTIIALTLRLADHLVARLEASA